MKLRSFMLVAGEPSGDLLAAELVKALRAELVRRDAAPSFDLQPLRTGLAPRFFGAGGPRMAEAGVDLALDMTQHAVVGLLEVLRHLARFRRLLLQLRDLAFERQPDAIVLVDFSGFNHRLAAAIRRRLRAQHGCFNNWQPKIVQYVSPQVWASRESRVRTMARDLDLLLSIFPFEKDWYALRAARLRVEFVGHPLCERYAAVNANVAPPGAPPLVVLLPGSRAGELTRHLPVMLEGAHRMQAGRALTFRLVLPNETLAAQARTFVPASAGIQIQVGGLAEALSQATLAIASTGTVTLECAYFGVPTVALYKTSWSTYQIGRRIIRVAFLAMPNILAGEALFPEFVQQGQGFARGSRHVWRRSSLHWAVPAPACAPPGPSWPR